MNCKQYTMLCKRGVSSEGIEEGQYTEETLIMEGWTSIKSRYNKRVFGPWIYIFKVGNEFVGACINLQRLIEVCWRDDTEGVFFDIEQKETNSIVARNAFRGRSIIQIDVNKMKEALVTITEDLGRNPVHIDIDIKYGLQLKE